MAFFEIIDCPFNRANYRDLINTYCIKPPAYVIVREIQPYRKHSCWNCHCEWIAAVQLSNESGNLSGEKNQYCPKCNTKSSCASAWVDSESKPWTFNPPLPPAYPTIDLSKQIIENFNPRRPLDDDMPDGYLESDMDYMGNNHEICIWFLEQLESIIEKKGESDEDQRG